jgi:phosphoglycerate dehydrogenase-like enzyme
MEVSNLEQRVADVDVVIPLMSLNPTSTHFVAEPILSRLPDDFVLINGARGDLIDQACLIDTLRSRPRAHAYLDVFRDEPFDCREFEGLKTVKLSSHVAGVFSGIDEKIVDFEEQTIGDFVSLKRSEFRLKYESLLLRNRIFGDFLI